MHRLQNQLELTKKASFMLAQKSSKEKNQILLEMIDVLENNKKIILNENSKDLEKAKKKKLSKVFIDRLTITEKVYAQIINQVKQIVKLPNPVGNIVEEKRLKNRILLKKVRVPLGVLGVIYEARPNVTVDAAALAIKSGNAVVLKGGSDAINSNRALLESIHKALANLKLPKEAVLFLDTSKREIVDKLLDQEKLIDVIIPRGGYSLVKKVVEMSKIPVLYHAEGGARIYVDASADIEKAVKICVNSKTSRPAVCNSLDTIVVNKKIAQLFLDRLVEELDEKKVKIIADKESRKIIRNARAAREKDFETEFLSLTLAIKTVKDIDEAIEFINKYSKKHSEGIVAQDKKVIAQFSQAIDAAGIFINCSTRFHDGGEFGLGAEIGVATGKLHARGPVGLQELTTYKWIAYGDGQIRI